VATDALIRHRDGIVGTWMGPVLHPVERALDDPEVLPAWEPWVRATVIDFDVTSHLYFTRHSETFNVVSNGNTVSKTSNDSMTIWHFHVPPTSAASPTATSSPLVTFIRPTPEILAQQLKFLDQYADLREDRACEILSQASTSAAFLASVAYLHPDRTKRTIELIDAAVRLAMYVEMRLKHALACRRPNELSPQVQPVILTPGHGTLPSGHSTENHMVARVLWELLGGTPGDVLGEQLMRQAARIAVNRTVAGVHFPVDSAAGQVLGLTLARYFVRRATGADPFYAWRFDGERWNGDDDFDFRHLYDTATAQQKPAPYVDPLSAQPPEMSPILNWLWKEARKEWA
jgi:hypothetical protein